MKILFLILISFFNYKALNADTLFIRSNLSIENTNKGNTQIICSIDDLNFLMDGYLVIEVLPNIKQPDSILYFAKIFFTENIDTQFNNDSIILYNGGISFMIINKLYNFSNDSINQALNIIRNCYIGFNIHKNKDCKPFLYERKNEITSNIFDKSILVQRDGKVYSIFRIKFHAILYEYFEEDSVNRFKSLIPTSNIEYFESENLYELKKKGFNESKIVIKLSN